MSNDLQRLKQRLLDAASTWGLAIILVVAGFVLAYQFVKPAPPKRIVLATGQEGGAYQYYGEQFAAYLATQGIETELRATAGSVENLELLESGADVDLGFVQGGLAAALPTENVVALGSLYLEPVWMFVRADMEIDAIADFTGKRIAVGAEGSGTRAVVQTVLNANDINAQTATLIGVPAAELADGFAANAIDIAFLISAPETESINTLIRQPGIRLQSIERTAAYVRRHSYFSSVSLPQGVLDLAAGIPVTEINTVALTAMLAANAELHPALVDLLLIAAADVFGEHTLLADAGEFPTSRYTDLPLSEAAKRYFKNGPPFLMRYLPFWAATLIDRLWIMLLPVIGLAIPLVKLRPPAYRWRIRKRLLRLYAELEQIDPLVNPVQDSADRAARLERLDQLDTGSVIGSVPKTYTDDIYKLRRDIDLVRRRLDPSQRL
jgi:TRAP transporter TAXI family solute receptor